MNAKRSPPRRVTGKSPERCFFMLSATVVSTMLPAKKPYLGLIDRNILMSMYQSAARSGRIMFVRNACTSSGVTDA